MGGEEGKEREPDGREGGGGGVARRRGPSAPARVQPRHKGLPGACVCACTRRPGAVPVRGFMGGGSGGDGGGVRASVGEVEEGRVAGEGQRVALGEGGGTGREWGERRRRVGVWPLPRVRHELRGRASVTHHAGANASRVMQACGIPIKAGRRRRRRRRRRRCARLGLQCVHLVLMYLLVDRKHKLMKNGIFLLLHHYGFVSQLRKQIEDHRFSCSDRSMDIDSFDRPG